MSLARGARFGSCEVGAQIGIGGMGEVYRAHDAKLNRDVALKVLPESFLDDADRVARFQREAHVLASLNHPNIAAIYGLEEAGAIKALVMELVEGPTLADRLASGPIPLDEALPVALQIAEALEAAHELGVIHRDLKPANIKVKSDGTVKVLDFGLAKNGKSDSPLQSPARSQSPTITTPAMTQLGTLLGTAAYMSPEQAKGRPADKRSDVWAFGCVFYEMLTGHRAFGDDDVSETLASVLKSDPDWTRIPPDLPQAVRTLIERCLVKDRRLRVSDISTAKFVLRELSSIGGSPSHDATRAGAAGSRWRQYVSATAAAVVTAAIVGAGSWALWPASRTSPVTQFSFTLPEGEVLSGTRQALAVSADGTRIAYAASSRLYLRPLDELESRAIPGTEHADVLGLLNPMFAPDGESIAYFLQGQGDTRSQVTFVVKRIGINGGVASTIGVVENLFGATWSTEGILVGGIGGVLRVSPDGSGTNFILRVAANERVHRPQLLPDAQTILATVANNDVAGWDNAQVVALSLRDGSRKVLIEGAADARYVPSGHVLYAVAGTAFAAPFDAKNLTLSRAPVPVIAGVRRVAGRGSATRQFAVSESGTLVYMPGPATAAGGMSLAIADGREQPRLLNVPFGDYAHPRVSPDGTITAIVRTSGQESDIWTYELSGKSEIRRLTFGGTNRFPVWSGDGKRIAFQSGREGDRGIFWQAADGASGVDRLTKSLDGEEHRPESWSRDGTHLLFSVLKDGKYALWLMRLNDKKTEPFAGVVSAEPLSASFSPDARWVVYASTPVAGGVLTPNRGVFIQPFPATGELHQVPKKFLDFHPAWAPEGKGIIYVAGATRPSVFVPVTTRPAVLFGTPVDLPRGPSPGLLSGDVRGYDVLPNGGFVSLAPHTGDPMSSQRPDIRVVLNWFENLKRVAPPR